MKTTTLWILTAVMTALGVYLLINLPGREMNREILSRSRQYVQTLGGQPLDKLTLEQKLILLHSHYNLKHYAAAVEIGEASAAELHQLSPERREAFASMMSEAYRRLGKDAQALAFREKMKPGGVLVPPVKT